MSRLDLVSIHSTQRYCSLLVLIYCNISMSCAHGQSRYRESQPNLLHVDNSYYLRDVFAFLALCCHLNGLICFFVMY